MNKKRYIEFIAPHGAGKSLIASTLKKKINDYGIKSIYYPFESQKKLSKYSKIKKIIFPIFVFPISTIKILIFSIKYKKFPHNFKSYTDPRKNKIKSKFKRLLREYFIFSVSNFDYFINEGIIHRILFYNPQLNYNNFQEILKIYPPTTIFVFVDIPPKIVLQRVKNRNNTKKIFINFIKKEQTKNNSLDLYEQAYITFNRFFNFLKKENTSSLIKINGENSPEQNIEYIINKIIKKNNI